MVHSTYRSRRVMKEELKPYPSTISCSRCGYTFLVQQSCFCTEAGSPKGGVAPSPLQDNIFVSVSPFWLGGAAHSCFYDVVFLTILCGCSWLLQGCVIHGIAALLDVLRRAKSQRVCGRNCLSNSN